MEKVLPVPNHLRLLQRAFQERRFTMRSVAKVVGVDHKTVHNYVFGKTPIPPSRVLKFARAALGAVEAQEFRGVWQNEEKGRLSFLNRSREKQQKIKLAERLGFSATVSVHSNNAVNEEALERAFQMMQKEKTNDLYRYLDLGIHHSPVDAFVDVYRRELSGLNTRVFLITQDHGLVFFPGYTSKIRLRNGRTTEISGTTGSKADWEGSIVPLKKYCTPIGIDFRALIALAHQAVLQAAELEPDNYEISDRVLVEKVNARTTLKQVLQVLKIIREGDLSSGKKCKAINHLNDLVSWLESLDLKASETVSAKAKLNTRISQILSKLQW